MDLSEEDLPAFLAESCKGNEELLRAVQDLIKLAADVDQDPLWTGTALQHEARASVIPENSRFDRYQVLERIGAGGMGAVYKAVRAGDQFSKLVAIKVVHDPDEAAVQRFIEERRILAALDHPNIARLLDGGTTPEGYPFLAMEYIEGAPIDRYVEERRLRPRQVLELFRAVCSAVSYAHRNLVVHRDLKPSNILVTADGTPKLLDFGIARLVDEEARRTRTGFSAMTLEYSSPEQIRGGIVGTASDIYSLAVVLYELLAGHSPYSGRPGTVELARHICEESAAPLSARAGEVLDPDVANIVAMAMRKEPARRYASADQMDEDIRRYLGGYPIMARADTRRYRLAKFIGRNKVYVAAGAAILIASVAGVGATIWQARIARREAALATARFNDLRELSNSYLFEFHDAVASLPGSTAARALVVKRALQYLDKLSKDASTNPELQRELAAAYERLSAA
ncbi:MAG: serine/threonine protein kinase, partial [Acidobacteriota bacterium]|nr:serine/threonine protein kinase [Acidobacteriota bacterium]